MKKTQSTGGDKSLGPIFQPMDNSANEYRHDVRSLSTEIYEISKRWLVFSMLCKLATFVLGIAAIMLAAFSQLSPFLVALLSAAAELSLWQSDKQRSLAEALRRKVDLQDSFDWKISRAEMSDLLVRVPTKVRKKIEAQTKGEPYFGSNEPPGTKRALENVRESAWWSKHLAEKTGKVYLLVMVILVIISLATLLVSIQTIRNFDVLSNIGRVVTSTIMLIFSLSLLKLTLGYNRFSEKAGRSEEEAEKLLSSDCKDLVQAVKVVNEYHLARAMAPMIPTWIWKISRNNLNELWKTYRSS